jgi:uncharacterized protein with GYD domain
MATYVVLVNFTDQGIRNIKDFPKAADAIKEMGRAMGVTLKDRYWTLGAYDLVAIWEAPDDATMTALTLSVGKLGNARTQTLRAFSQPEMAQIVAKVT